MSVSIAGLIVQADAAVSGLGQAPSTRMQYRWAWSQFEKFCSRESATEFSEEAVASFLLFVAAEHRRGRFKEWKYKLLRKSVLVLSEVAGTGAYEWKLSRQKGPNDALDAVFRPVQEQFEVWLGNQGLAVATKNLYATVSHTVLAWLPEHGVHDVRGLAGADVPGSWFFPANTIVPAACELF